LTFGYLSDVMERSLKLRKSEGSVPPGRSASFDYRVGFALAVLERARRIDTERRAAEQQQRHRAARAFADGMPDASETDIPRRAGLTVMKRQIVQENCMDGLITSRPKRVRYRNGSAHAAGSTDGSQVSLDKQVSAAKSKAIR
jgi:hypothetical protein